MYTISDSLLDEIRSKFAHVSECPIAGERVFFESAGGALTLKSVVETSAYYAAIPDNQGRDNETSKALMDVINRCRAETMELFNVEHGQVFVGESGTELLFRIIEAVVLAAPDNSVVVSSTLEHPASFSAARRWAKLRGIEHKIVLHDDATGTVTADDYREHVSEETKVATIIHTSPVTGITVDIAQIARTIRAASPDCFIIVDGIQHAAHGAFDFKAYDIDAYVISPYKVFSRHGYGLAWVSDRVAKLPHNMLENGLETNWELGTRDTGAYATFVDVIAYLDWLGGRFVPNGTKRERLVAAGRAIHNHEQRLAKGLLFGTGGQAGLAEMNSLRVIGGVENAGREGLVSFVKEGWDSAMLVRELGKRGIRVHTRKADHYSGNILKPLGYDSCVRVSFSHYNSLEEVGRFLVALSDV